MRMPISQFFVSGDLKFMLTILIILILAIVSFIKKVQDKENQTKYNLKLKTLSNWALIIGLFSLFLGLMHSMYFISKANGIAPNLLYRGLANTLIAPVFATAVCILIKLLSTPLKQNNIKI